MGCKEIMRIFLDINYLNKYNQSIIFLFILKTDDATIIFINSLSNAIPSCLGINPSYVPVQNIPCCHHLSTNMGWHLRRVNLVTLFVFCSVITMVVIG
jgi:hypothetical protein